MMRKMFVIAVISLLAIAFLASITSAKRSRDEGEKTYLSFFQQEANKVKNLKMTFSGAETFFAQGSGDINEQLNVNTQSLGYNSVESASPGKVVFNTTYDLQSNTRCNRMVDWRISHDLHFIAMCSSDSASSATVLDRGTKYDMWSVADGSFEYGGGEGCKQAV